MKKTNNLIPVLAYLLAALFLCYEMALQAATGVMTHDLMKDFSANAHSIGLTHAGYFLSYTAMQIPAGILFDKYSTRTLIIYGIISCALGSLIFATTDSIPIAVLARFIEGAGSAFAFIGTLVVAAKWFNQKWFSLLVGIAQALAAIGAMSAGAPLAIAVNTYGWRQTLIALAIVGFSLVPAIWITLRQSPNIITNQKNSPINKALLTICKNKQLLLIALYSFCSWGPITIFAELWGESFLAAKFNISIPYAAGMVAMIWLGLTLFSPILGWLSETLENRKSLAFLTALIGAVSTAFLIYKPIPEIAGWLLLILFGVAASGQILSFAMIRDIQPKNILATSIGFINMALVAGGAILSPIVSALIHKNWQGNIINGTPHYQLNNYQDALWIVPVCYLIAALLMQIAITETYKK